MEFQSGKVVAHIDEWQIAHTICTGHFEDYGYFALADAPLADGGVYFDVGANFGFHSFGLQAISGPAVEFHLFEANPVCCQSLRYTMQLVTANTHLCQGALGDQEGEVYPCFTKGKTGEGRITSDYSSVCTRVPSYTLDVYCERAGISQIRLMKMDIEGSEWHALTGGKSLFESAAVDFCYFEVNQAALAKRSIDLDKLFAFFDNNNYTLFWPHSSDEWIKPRLIENCHLDTSIYHIGRDTGLLCRRFEPEFLSRNMSHQFDLLAVSPQIAVLETETTKGEMLDTE